MVLARILAGNANAETVKPLGKVETLRELQSRAPVTTYADVAPLVRRQMEGEEHVLSDETPIFFASSTGTTGAPKRTPATPSFRRDCQRTVHVSMAHVAPRFPAAFTGQALYYVGSRELDRAPCGTPIGFTSGFTFSSLPKLVRRLYTWPYELFEVQDIAARDYLAAWLAAVRPVTFFAAVFPLAPLALFRAWSEMAAPLARDLRAGTLRDDLAITPAQRALFLGLARRDGHAADRIEACAREEGGVLPVRAILPHLRLLYCWTGASASHYVPELVRRVGPNVAVRDAIYAANEAWANVTFGDEAPGGPAAITSNVQEYVEEDAWERGAREGVLADALVPGRRYRMLVTTSAGLLRYDLGDIVECTGTFHRTATLRFARRAGASLSIAGEKLDESHVVKAVGRALAELGFGAELFVAYPRFVPSPRWELAIELDRAVTNTAMEALRSAIDRALGEEADDYRIYRKTTLGPLALLLLQRGESARLRREAIARGGPDAQLKAVNLSIRPDEPAHAGWRIDRVIDVS